MGAWVASLQQPVVAFDLLSFEMFWPWPLFNRSFGVAAQTVCQYLCFAVASGGVRLLACDAGALQSARVSLVWRDGDGPRRQATDPAAWVHLHHATTLLHEAAPTPAANLPPSPLPPRARCGGGTRASARPLGRSKHYAAEAAPTKMAPWGALEDADAGKQKREARGDADGRRQTEARAPATGSSAGSRASSCLAFHVARRIDLYAT
eukprot:361260-Prymnesium_polylepis.1